MYLLWATDVSGAGFTGIETFSYDAKVVYAQAAWRARITARAAMASLSVKAVGESFDTEHAAMLAEGFPGEILPIPHCL